MRPHPHPELAVADLPVPVLVHRVDHLVDLLVRHLQESSIVLFFSTAHLARQVGHDELELLGGDAPLVVLAEHPERLLQLTFL